MKYNPEVLELYFEDREINYIAEGENLPAFKEGLDKLVFNRIAHKTLGKVCLEASRDELTPHSTGNFGDLGDSYIYELKDNVFIGSTDWDVHIDIAVPTTTFSNNANSQNEEPAITNPTLIRGVELCYSPIRESFEDYLDDYTYEGQIYTREYSSAPWLPQDISISLEEHTNLLHLVYVGMEI